MTTRESNLAAHRIAFPQAEAARLLGVTDRTLRRWTSEKLIEGNRIAGGVVLYRREEIERMLKGRQ